MMVLGVHLQLNNVKHVVFVVLANTIELFGFANRIETRFVLIDKHSSKI